MLEKINQSVAGIKSFLTDIRRHLAKEMCRVIEKQLEAEVTKWLYRDYHERKADVKRQGQAQCQRCGSRATCHFMRNGHRKRQLVTQMGVLEFWLPRVVCQCGGSVAIPFSILKPYQQIWEDVLDQIGRWADLGLSLRQMQTEIGDQCSTQVGLRLLNETVNTDRTPNFIQLRSVPPIVMLDAIWVTLLKDTDTTQQDLLNRQRRVKARHKVCVLVALGLYPQREHWGILGWQIADEESQTAWESLLTSLETRGLYRQRGLELFVHDGGKGLIAALNYLYPRIPHQRCIFHKLRNLWHSLQTPQDLSIAQRRAFKHGILQQVQAIFEAQTLNEACSIQQTLVTQFQHSQPDFVATLQRHWHETIAFFRVLKHFPDWQRTALRTTSLLERVNRMLRRLFRPKGAFHSLAGLRAATARVLNPLRLI